MVVKASRKKSEAMVEWEGWIKGRLGTPVRRVAAAALLVMLVTAGCVGQSYFLAIPWKLRKSTAHVVVPVIVLAALAVAVRKRKVVLTPSPGDNDQLLLPVGWHKKLAAVLPALAASSLIAPLLWQTAGIGGVSDWDQFLQKYEAIRVSIAQYGQFPWWNPWRRGGFPLAADPETGVASIATVLVLGLGSSIGLRAAAVVYAVLAAEGARRLALLLLREPLGAAMAAVVYALNGAAVCYLAGGLFIPMSYAWLPWLLRGVLCLERSPSMGWQLGVWACLALLSGIQYPTVYAFLIVGLIWGLRWLEPGMRRAEYLRSSLAAVGLVLLLCSWRLVPSLYLLGEFPRDWDTLVDRGPLTWMALLWQRPTGVEIFANADRLPWETVSYVGPVVLLLAVWSVTRGWQWWHTLMVMCFLCALGSRWWYQPSFWLNDWPLLGDMHFVHRWRLPGMIGLGLAAGSVITQCSASTTKWGKYVAWLAIFVVTADYLACGWQWLPPAFLPPTPQLYPAPAVRILTNLEDWPPQERAQKPLLADRPPPLLTYPAMIHGYGVIRAHEALLGYDRNLPTARRWLGHREYKGEAWTDAGEPVEPIFWSPNRIDYQVGPNELLHLNVNPGSWWLINGKRLFPKHRAIEWLQPLLATADESGMIRLRIRPPRTTLSLVLTLLGGLMVIWRIFLQLTAYRPSVRCAKPVST